VIVIVDYDLGNSGSVANMFKRQGITAAVTRDPAIVSKATRLVLGGVGSFDEGMANIQKLGLRDVLDEKVLGHGVPIIGFCLGMQLMTKGSEEGQAPGLGWIDAQTVHLRTFREEIAANLKFPQIGWNFTYPAKSHQLLQGLSDPMRFYFVHTYKVVCADVDNVLVRAAYGGIPFTAGFVKDNIAGVQFHPEKSHRHGMNLLANFAKWQPIISKKPQWPPLARQVTSASALLGH
jgi:imidazole glycerol-phosphate synthase subunit HisH